MTRYRLHRSESQPNLPRIKPGQPFAEDIHRGITVHGLPGLIIPQTLPSDSATTDAIANISNMATENFPSEGRYVAGLLNAFENVNLCSIYMTPWTRLGSGTNQLLEHRLTVSREGDYLSMDDEFSNPYVEQNELLRTAVHRSFTDRKPMIVDYELRVDDKVGVKLIFDDLNMKNKSGNIYPLGEEEKRASSGSIAFMPFYYRDPEHPSGVVLFEGNLKCKGTGIGGIAGTIWSATATMVAARQMSLMLTHKFDAITVLTRSADFKQDFVDDIRKLVTKQVRGIHLITIDIDDFRVFNKKHGRQVGDEVLRCVADAIKTSVRSEDSVSRVGGEEFCVILRNVSRKEAETIAERIRKNVAEKKAEAGNLKLNVTCSLGLATVDSISDRLMDETRFSSEEETIQKIYKTAEKESDDLMRMAKSRGKNRVCMGEYRPTPA